MRFVASPATPADLPAACRLLASHRPAADREPAALRYRDLLTSGEFDPAGLFVARDEGGELRGAVLVQSLPGALGLAWPPRVEPGRGRQAVEDALVSAACGWLQSRGVNVCQSFAPDADRDAMAPLARHGFRLVTQLAYLRREIDPERDSHSPGGFALTFDRIGPNGRDAFGETLLATYDGSLDCPEAAGTRTPDEMLDGFRGPLSLRAGWYLAHHRGEPVGVVLFDPGTEPGALELTYLGLVPAARGRGWGSELVRFAVHRTAADGHHALTLSVDVRNAPALRVYERHGFRAYDRRDVYLAELAPPG